jgi:hypothetical protein
MPPKLLRTSHKAVKAKFGIAPALWDRISQVVGVLRVATPCYIAVCRTLLGRRVSMPNELRHAALGHLRLSSVGRLLRRTSENYFPRTPVNSVG